jgi:cellobiose-specific phosphotransferase system component IIC
MVSDVVVAACAAAVVVRVVVVRVQIEVVEQVTDEVVKAFERLLP